jgi:putative transcriptional regulator
VASKAKSQRPPTDKERLRREIVEMTEGQHRLGLVSADELQQVTMRMLGCDALPKVPLMSAAEIVKVREHLGVSQAVFVNVETQTISVGGRGTRRPTGTALKLLHVVKARELEVFR